MTKDNLIKIKEYGTYILFQHKDTKIKECFLKVDLGLVPVVYTCKELRERRRKKKYDSES